MASLNKVMLIGNLGRDPEVSYTPSGMAIAKFSIATTDFWTDKATGERKDKTEWHRIVAFAKLAETCGRYLTKGKQIYVEGRLQTSSYEKDGITRYSTDIIANTMQFLGAKGEGSYQGAGAGGGAYPQNNGPQGGGFQNPKANFQQPSRGPQNPNHNQQPQPEFDPYGADQAFHQPPDDDIPF
ncbi:MAG: single-stranded DNA-binding protein [Proteobacteria bacterium]|nr:single-stranded DNA-binding protein [Pseudomonadota bacterium]